MFRIRLVPIREGPLLTCGEGVTVIGSGDDCDARIPHYAVSERHCSLQATNGTLILRDLGSMAGTAVNGQPTKRSFVDSGDVIEIGGLPFRLEIIEVAPAPAAPIETPPKGSSVGELITQVLNEPPILEGALRSAEPDPIGPTGSNVEQSPPRDVPATFERAERFTAPSLPESRPRLSQRRETSRADSRSLRRRLSANWTRGLAKFLGCIAIAALVFFPWGELTQTSNESLYRFYASALDEIVALRARKAPSSEWEALRQRLEPQNRTFVQELTSTSGTERPIRQQFLFAGRDHLPGALGGDSPQDEDSLRIVLENARSLLDGTQFEPPPEDSLPASQAAGFGTGGR